MVRIRWGCVLLVALSIIAAAHSRAIGKAIAELRLGEMWREFTELVWSGPAPGRFAVVCLTLCLVFVSAYMLLLSYVRQRSRRKE